MLRQHILRAIADAVDRGGDELVAMAALRSVDPLLRFWARRRLRLALTAVLVAAPPSEQPWSESPDPEYPDPEYPDQGTVLRLTYLSIAGAQCPAQACGTMATIRAFETLRREAYAPARYRWWLSGLLALVTLVTVGCGGLLGFRALRDKPPQSPHAPPHPTGAFAQGGVPRRGGPVLDRALGQDLPDFLIALDAWRRARGEGMLTGEPVRRLHKLETLQDRLETRRVRMALGESAALRLSWLLRVTRALATTRQVDRLTKLFVQSVVAFNDALAAHGLGYYLDSDVFSATGDVRHVILYVFRVERVQRFRASNRLVTALQLRRLDTLNWAHSALGFTRREHHEALVLLDSVDDILVSYLLPALGTSRMQLVDKATAQAGLGLIWPQKVSVRAAVVIERELARIPDLNLGLAKRLAGLLARRQALIARWQHTLSKSGRGLVEPTGLTLDWNYRRALKHVVAPKQLQEMAQLDRALGAPPMQRTLAALRGVIAKSVAHHEVQHRLDYDGLVSLSLPEVLRRRVGPLVQRGRVRLHVQSARNELSAYLAELARARHTTQLELALITRLALDQRNAASPESHAAEIILEGLAKLLGLVLTPGPNTQHSGERARYALLYLHLTHQSPSTLRCAAQHLWEDLFDMDLPELTMAKPGPGTFPTPGASPS